MIGRDEEQSALHAFLAAVPGGPAALVLTGTAGAGKTTLWKAGLAGALERSYRVLQTSPAQSEAALSFAGVADLLDEVLEESVASLPAPQRRALEVALLLSEAEGPAPDQRAVGVAFLGAVRALSQRGSIVVAVDDVQWLDAASTAALAFAARRLRDEPAGWLLAQRADGEAAVPLALDRALPEERLRRLEVGPLGIDDLHRLLRARLGASFSRPVLRRLHETAGGNPFFALELARALERGSIAAAPGEPLPVPANLRELVRSRLEALPPETREALTVAAALAQPTLALTGAVAQTDAAECLRPAVQADVVGLEDERIRFTHPLLASGSYEAASTGARRRIHARIAELVDDPEERARHLALAVAGPDAAVAASLDDAAHRAHARGSQGAAAELSDQAFRLTPPEHPREARRRAVESASYAFMAGDTPRARGLLED
nr:AAA family ATPase [Actinomycetota bacterium]